MASVTYIRPIGRLTQPPSRINAPPSKIVRVAEREDVVFAATELIQRHAGDWIDRRILSMEDVLKLGLQPGPQGEQVKRALTRLASPRSPIGELSLSQPRIMGIVNVTPDSFSDGGRFVSAKDAIAHAMKLEEDGADILDIGGESTRPGAATVSLDEELRRVMPVIEGLAGRVRSRLSIDTRKAEVMRRAANAGVHLLNDVSALAHDPQSLRVAAETRLPVVLMHAQGNPDTMQREPKYKDALLDVFDQMDARIEICVRAGIPRERLIVDPGIGFGKTAAHNLEIVSGLSLYHTLGTPVMLGVSRKSFIGSLTGAVDPADRVPGSLAAALVGVMQGAQILRVHDVAATRQAITIWQASANGVAGQLVG